MGGGGWGGVYNPLNSPITMIKLVNSPITNNSKLSHQPLSRVTKISCITIHNLKNAFLQSPGIKIVVHQSPDLIYSQFTFLKIANSRFTRNKTGHSPITKIVYTPPPHYNYWTTWRVPPGNLLRYNFLRRVFNIWYMYTQKGK